MRCAVGPSCGLQLSAMVAETVFFGSYTSDPPTGHTNYMEGIIGPSKSEGIYRAQFDTTTGVLSQLTLAAQVHISPSWLQWHPCGLPVLFATNSTFDGRPR
jgi:6-phosphogluconolactonase (cycloisomerase 2 family)